MTTKVFMNGRSQAVRIPKEFRFKEEEVTIQKCGDGILVQPARLKGWPKDWFEAIQIDDEGFDRPVQGDLPPIQKLTGKPTGS
jgi:antitoxin VapB